MTDMSWTAQQTQVLSIWMKTPVVSTMLSNWVWDVLKFAPKETIKAAALVGTTMGHIVKIGQVSHEYTAKIARLSVRTTDLAFSLDQLGRECCMSSKASILRTAIMLGLGLPRIELGVMSRTRHEPMSLEECTVIISRAKSLYPQEPL